MPIADSNVHRVIDYIERVSSEGCNPTVEQAHAYAANPYRSGFLNFLKGEFANTNMIDWLQSVGWIDISSGNEPTVSLTDLGRATLGALRKTSASQHTGRVVLFSGSSPFDYARFVSELAELPKFTLVDPFLRKIEHLADLLEETECSRILINSKLDDREKSTLGIALRKVHEERLDIRVAAKHIHDRFVIPESGSIFSFGTSISGLNKHFSVLVEIPEPNSDRVREQHQAIWSDSTSLRDLEI